MTRRLTEDGPCSGASATIEWLDNDQSCQVRVTAVGDEGEGPAASGSATPRRE